MDRYLRQATQKLQATDRDGAFHEDTVPALLALFRQYLEASRQKKRYRITNFYCNWSLHVSLDRGVGEEILTDISAIISDPNELDIGDRISEQLSMRQLRAEIVQILASAGISSPLFSSHMGWTCFVAVALRSLVEKPLTRTLPPASTRYAQKLWLDVPDLSGLPRDYITAAQLSQNTVFWNVQVLPKDYTLKGPLALTERPEDFELRQGGPVLPR